MSWHNLAKILSARSDPAAVKIAVERKRVTIKLGPGTLDAMRWEAGDRIAIDVGQDEHLGSLRLAKGSTGWLLRSAGGGGQRGLAVRFARATRGWSTLPLMPDRLVSKECEVTIADGAVIIKLPWFDLIAAKEQHPMRAAVADPAREIPEAPAGTPAMGVERIGEANARLPDEADHRRSRPATVGQANSAGDTEQAGGKPAPRPFPLRTRSLAEVDAAPTPRGAWIGRMSVEQTEKFVQAVARDALQSELLAIISRPPGLHPKGTLGYFKLKLADRIAAAKAALPKPPKPSLPPPVAALKVPEKTEPAPAGVPVKPPIPEAILQFLRAEIVPVLSPLGRKVTKTREGDALMLDGKPATLDEIVAEANRILGDMGDEPLVVPEMAEAAE